MTDASVSVVIPCYNGESVLHDAIESAINQTHQPTEIIVVDDGSTDASASLAESFGGIVRVLRQENQGESVARNRGIDESSGRWIAFLDADDVWESTKLERQLTAVGESPANKLACVYTDYYRFRMSKGKVKRLGSVERRAAHEASRPLVEMLAVTCAIPSTAMVDRETMGDVRFPADIQAGEDAVFFAELRSRGDFHRIPTPLTGYRESAQQQSRSLQHRIACIEAMNSWSAQRPDLYDGDDLERLRKIFIKRCDWYRKRAIAVGDKPSIELSKRVLGSLGSVPQQETWFQRWLLFAYFQSYRLFDRLVPGGLERAREKFSPAQK